MDTVNVVKWKYLCFLKKKREGEGGKYLCRQLACADLKTPIFINKKIFKNPSLPIYFGL